MYKTNKQFVIPHDVKYTNLIDTTEKLLGTPIDFSDRPAILTNISHVYYIDNSKLYTRIMSTPVIVEEDAIPDINKLEKVALSDDGIVIMKDTSIDGFIRDEGDGVIGIHHRYTDVHDERERFKLTSYIREHDGRVYAGFGYKIHSYIYILNEIDATKEYGHLLAPVFTIGEMDFELPRVHNNESRITPPAFKTVLTLDLENIRDMPYGALRISIGHDGDKNDGNAIPYYLIEYLDGNIVLNRLSTKEHPDQTKYLTDVLTDGSGVLKIKDGTQYNSIYFNNGARQYKVHVVRCFDFSATEKRISRYARVTMDSLQFDIEIDLVATLDDIKEKIEHHVTTPQ